MVVVREEEKPKGVVVAAVRAPSRSPRGGDARGDELVLKV
jgi:hypothetical protein